MRTFKEWVEENHPEDELVNEFLGQVAKKLANTKLGRAAILMGGMAMGGSSGQGAAPMAPGDVAQHQEHGDWSEVPFSKDLAVQMASEMGLDPQKMAVMDDFDAWHKVMTKVNQAERDMTSHHLAVKKGALGLGHKSWPKWYIKLGMHYNPGAGRDVTKWRAPAPPKVGSNVATGMVGVVR